MCRYCEGTMILRCPPRVSLYSTPVLYVKKRNKNDKRKDAKSKLANRKNTRENENNIASEINKYVNTLYRYR